MNARTFLVRGLLAGLIAGFVAFGVAYVIGEPSVNAAIAIEESGGMAGHTHEAEPPATGSTATAAESHDTEVPRSLQSTLGLLTGTLVAGTVLGGLVGVVSALALGRLGGLSPRASTLSVAALGFVGVYLVPTLGYPPNPPAVGQPDTIGYRTALYFILTAVSLIALTTAVLIGRRLIPRLGGWHAFLLCGLGYVVVCLAAIGVMPTYDDVPHDFPATVLFEFRRASLITQLAMWGTIGIALAEFVGRLTRPTGSRPHSVTASVS
jgi:predicted cobalt transporter CbtA